MSDISQLTKALRNALKIAYYEKFEPIMKQNEELMARNIQLENEARFQRERAVKLHEENKRLKQTIKTEREQRYGNKYLR